MRVSELILEALHSEDRENKMGSEIGGKGLRKFLSDNYLGDGNVCDEILLILSILIKAEDYLEQERLHVKMLEEVQRMSEE